MTEPSTPTHSVSPQAQARSALNKLIAEIGQKSLLFTSATEPSDDSVAELRHVADSLKTAGALAATAGVTLHLTIDGYSDAPGTAVLNAKLRMARAEWLRDSLRQAGAAAALLDDATLSTTTDASAGVRGAKLRVQIVEAIR